MTVIQHYEDYKKMKKTISILSIFALFLTNYVYAEQAKEQDKVSVEVCKEGAVSDGISGDKMKEYIDKCVKDIADDEKREQMEMQKGS